MKSSGFSSMHQQHLSRRRKKRPIHGIKTVQVTRGRSGYGFTISGQNPCILSCIVGGSPADLAGLKAGDYLYVVNGINVSRALHDDVVRMVGQSTGTLELQVAENYNSSDSSEDDYSPRTKTRYPNRVRPRQQPAGTKQPSGMASRPLPQRPTDMKASHGRQRNHAPIGAESSVPASSTYPLSSAGDEKSPADYNEQTNAHSRAHYESIKVGKSDGRYRNAKTHGKHAESSTTDTTGEGFAFTTIQNGPVVSTAKISSGISKRPLSRAQELQTKNINPPVSREGVIKYGHAVDDGQDLDHDENDQNVDESEAEEEEGIPSVEHGTRAVVGYIGSIELPGNATRPNQRLQLLRSAVRRLRIEQKIHTLVLMEVNQGGVHLTSNTGTTIAHYSVEKLAFSGVCPDDKRFFGIVTLHSASDDVSEFSGTQEERSPSSSCHIFMVDPDMCPHMLHCHKARAFNLQCTPSPSAQRCLEFPLSPTHLILCIASLYRDRPRSKLDNEIIQSHAFADPSQPAERSNSNSSNSDSGLGFGREDGAAEQVCVVDMPSGGNPTAAGSAFQPCRKGQSQLHPLLPGMPLSATRGMQRPLSAFEIRRGLNNSSSSEECWVGHRRTDKLTPRAMPDPANVSLLRATSAEGLGRGHSAENLRQSMQRLLQARQQRLEQDQALSSDSESQTSSRVNTNLFSSHSAFQVPRSVSVPLQSHGRLQRSSEAVEMVDMRIGKLSPRAFKQPADILRSPSAPPIPFFPHQDSDDEDDDTESEDDPFVRKIISQFNRDRLLDLGEENPRRYSEGFALTQKRDMVWGEVAELQKWTKTGSFRRPQNTKMMSNISHSHESLVVGDVNNSQSQKLLSANSVNSILHPSSPPVEDEVRCVAGWAVGFQRLLSDPDGLRIFKEFLKKEYSEENIDFWSAVETYRQIPDCDLKRVRALEIFSKYLDHNASSPVNVDSSARLFAERFFDAPTSSMFDMAQQQVFHLMRQDSYVRFLKSDLYKGLLMREMEGHSLPLADTEMPPPTADAKKKKGKGKENEEKRRRSLLPWRQNKKSNKKMSSDSELKQTGKGLDKKGKEEVREEVNNNNKKAPGPGIDLSTMRKEVFHPRESNNAEGTEQFKFCRVMMPDGSTTVVCTRPGQNIRTVLGKLCEKRALSIAAVEVFLFGSDKPLDLGEDVSTLGSKEVVIERRVLFRLDLPTHKSIGVKAKPNRSIRDVFKPILNKYGYRIDNVGVQLSGMPELLDIDIPVSDIDNQRVIIIPNERGENAESCAEGGQASTKAAVPTHHRRTPFLLPSRIRGGKGGSLEEITNKIFDDLMKGKSELAHTFDDLGVVDLERSKGHRSTDDHRSLGLFGRLKKDTWGAKDRTKQKNKGRVTFSLPRNDARKNEKVKEDEHLMELIAHNQCQQLQAECQVSEEHQARSDFLCTDAVEHVDVDAFNSLFDFRPVSIFSSDADGSLLPPPDMFDDVQYMHSGVDGTMADFDEEFVDGAAAGDHSLQMRGGFSTFLPKRKQVTCDQTLVADKHNPYLSMHPVIVDTKMGEEEKDEIPSSGLSRSLHTIFETISSQSSGANSIRAFSPGVGQWQDQVLLSAEKSSPLLSLDSQTTSQNDPEKQQRPVPARRRLLDQNNSSSLSIIPNSQLTTSSVQDQDLTTKGSSQGTSSSPSNVNTRQSSSSIPLSRPLHPPTYSTAMGMREALGQSHSSLSGAGTSLSRSQLTNTLNIGRRHSQANTSFLNDNPSPAGPNIETEPVRDHRSYSLSARDSPKTRPREPLPGYLDNALRNDKLRKYSSSGSHPSKHVATSKQQAVNAVEEFLKDSIKDDPLWSRSQTPDVIASRRSRTPDVISPRRLGPTSLSRKEEEASIKSVVVAAEVHHQHHHTGLQMPDLQCNAPPCTFDTDSFSDLTVTFV